MTPRLPKGSRKFLSVLEKQPSKCILPVSPARLNPGDLKVRVEVKGDVLFFSVQNPVARNSGNKLDEPGGIGLPNVRKRLALLYPQQHSLEIHNAGETFAVVLNIHGLQLNPDERKTHLLYN